MPLLVILLVIICIAMLVVHRNKSKKAKEAAESRRSGPESGSAASGFSAESKLKGSMAAAGFPNGKQKMTEREGVQLYAFSGAKNIWICSNCETENPHTAGTCAVCHSSRQGE